MASTVDKYSEAEGVVETVIKIFSERADPNTAREAGRDIADLKRRVTERHQEMIKSIRELSGQADRARRQLNERRQASDGSSAKEEMLTTKSRLDQSITRMRQENISLQQNIGAAETRVSELSAREQTVRQQEAVEVPRARHTISLYANISSIRWDFNSPLVKGFVTSAEGAGIKAFEMDPVQTSSFEMTNRLWDLIDSK